MNHSDLSQDRLDLAGSVRKMGPVLFVIGCALLLFSIVLGSSHGWPTFWKSYLIGFMVSAGIALGALFFVMLQHITRSGWSVTVRRLAEGMARNLVWMWILFTPIIIMVLKGDGALLYQWGDTYLMEHDHLLHKKAAYLSPTFWSARAIFYLLVWAVLAYLYFKWSTKQDVDGDVKWTHKMQQWAPLGIILYGLTQSYAAIDWMRS